MASSYSKELAALREAAGSALGRQRDVLDTSARILADAARLAGRYGRTDLGPRVRDEYDARLAPLISTGFSAGRKLLKKTPLAPRKSGLGGYIAAGFTIALVAGAAYLAWQVLRSDNEAWVDDDFDVD